MAIAALTLLALYLGLAVWLALRADRRFRRHARLPMQWWVDGQPTWYLPRRVALVAIPAVSGMGLLLLVVMLVLSPRVRPHMIGSLGLTLVFVTVIGIGVFALYLRMVAMWDRARP
jgi:hypothetical protein